MKFRLTTLLGLGLFVATGMMVLVLQQKNNEIQRLKESEKRYADEIGQINDIPVNQVFYRVLPNHYFGDCPYAVRIRVPDLSKTKLYIYEGELPSEGFPKKQGSDKLCLDSGAGPGDYIVSVTDREMIEDRVLIRSRAEPIGMDRRIPGHEIRQVLFDLWPAQPQSEGRFSPSYDPGNDYMASPLDKAEMIYEARTADNFGIIVWLETEQDEAENNR